MEKVRRGRKKDVLICSVGLWVRKSRNDFKLKAFNQIEISFPICACDVRGRFSFQTMNSLVFIFLFSKTG